ncbi:MAG: ABC transporter ATP-binding protein [Planctomycetota bacterium]
MSADINEPTAFSADPHDRIVVAQQLTKIFKDFWLRDLARAVDAIDFEIYRGEIFGLLGPNGSGKSTTIKMILGLLRPSKGRLAVFRRPPSDVSVKKRIGYLPEESYLYPFLNARETLEYYGKLFELDYKTRTRRADELLDMVGLAAVQHRQIVEYSKGMQRRIGIAQALINDPEFLILDEPTTGLDPIGTRQVKDLITELGRRNKTVLLSSHLLADVEDVVDRMVILYGGKVRAEGTCDELLASKTRSSLAIDGLDEDTLAEVRAVIERRGGAIAGVDRPRQKLEDLFVGIVQQAKEERLATSGATNEGDTAAFLKGDEAAKQGDELLESLSQPEEHADVEAPAPATPAAPPEAAPDVVESLLDANTERQAPIDAGQPGGTPDEPGDVDEVIGSLLGGDDEQATREGER